MVLSFLACAGGCWTTAEQGKQMAADLETLKASEEANVQALRTELAETKRALNEVLSARAATLEERQARLEAEVAELKTTARRTDADLFADFDRMRQEMQTHAGQVEETLYKFGQIEAHLNKSIEELQAQLSGVQGKLDATTESIGRLEDQDKLPKNKKEFYQLAYDKIEAKEYEKARELFRLFLQRWPDELGQSDNAIYWIGESFYAQKQFQKAILEFREIIQRFPKGAKVEDAYLKIGFAFAELGHTKEALAFLEELLEKFPSTKLKSKAQARIKELKAKPAARGKGDDDKGGKTP